MIQSRLILVAEDEPDAARLLELHLRRRGYRTTVAADGRDALNQVFEFKPDLILLDLMLPHLHGYEVCRLTKSAASTRHIPVLILSALAATEYKVKGFQHGADDYLSKPYQMVELLARVQALLRRTAPAVRAGEFTHL